MVKNSSKFDDKMEELHGPFLISNPGQTMAGDIIVEK
jgi:hypothetical protein